MKHWSTLPAEELGKLPIHKKLAWLLFWRRFIKLGIVGEGPMAEELMDEVASELESIMEQCRKEGRESIEKKAQEGR